MELTIAGFELDRRKLIALALLVLGCAGLALLYKQIDVAALHRRAEELNGAWVFVLMTLLPLVGFPVTVGHAVAGVRFGLPLGLALVSISITLQMLLSYGLVKLAPKLFARHLEPLRKRLPKTAHTPLTQFTMLLPGVPYFAQNYVLPLMGVPLGTYLLWGVPIHVVRAIVGIAFGDMSDHLTPLRLAGFAVYAIVITATCAWAFRRLQARMKDRQSAAGDPKPRASNRSAARARARSKNRAK
jgi:uncharacterized membrane protein YdjX (TVP38/TMEM64 family)